MTLPGRKVAALGFVIGLETLTWACGSRTPPPRLPIPPQAAPPLEPTSPPPSTPTPTPVPPATTAPGREADPLDCALITESGDAIATVALTDPGLCLDRENGSWQIAYFRTPYP